MNIKNMTEEQLVLAQKWIDAVKKITYKEFSSIDNEKFNNMYKGVEEAESAVYMTNKVKAFPETYVFDENESVKWNREKVIEENSKQAETLKELRQKKKELENLMNDALFSEVEENYQISRAAAEILWARAYSDNHSEGYSSVLSLFEEYLDLFKEVLCSVVGERMK